jgi:acyl-CoA oxidase
MFIPTIENQTDAEQKKRWLENAKNFKMLGTYAQTELGHGEKK